MKYVLFAMILTMLPVSVFASFVINEVMYDLDGSDTGREWVEVLNNGTDTVDISTWKFIEAGVNHGLVLSSGDANVPAGGFAIISDNPSKFLTDWPSFSGTVFDSSFSLLNTGESLALSDGRVIVDQVSYQSDWGGAGDGNSIQKIGSGWGGGQPTPGAVNNNSPISQPVDNNQDEENTTPTQQTNETSNTTTFPVDQRVFAEITLNTKSLIAGAQFFISGEGYGLEKKPLANARFLWNFGDGTVKSGQSVAHTYKNPGDYLIVLDVSSEKFSGTARQLVSAIKSPLSISITKNDDGNLVKISNDASVELDLSGWFIESQDGRFTIPLHTIVLPKKYLIFDPEVLGFNIGTKVSLLYPTGSVANANEGVIPASKIITTTAQLPKAPVSSPVKVVPNKNDINQEILTSNQVGSVISATDGALTDEKIRDDVDQGSSAGWIFAFIALLGIATGSVFLIKRPVYNQADEFTIEE